MTTMRMQTTDAQERLIAAHLSFARCLARRLARTLPVHVDGDALESDAYLGLLLAARSFDPDRRIAFTTFAAHRIHGAMLDGLRQRQVHGRRRCQVLVHSLSSPIGGHEQLTLADVVASEQKPVGQDLEDQELAQSLLNRLEEPQRQLLHEHYLQGQTQVVLGRKAGVSAPRISQKIKAARRKLLKIAQSN